MENRHFNQSPKRKAEFMIPPNVIKQKVGSGGVSEEILDKAQTLLEQNAVDFTPLAEIYLGQLMGGIHVAKNPPKDVPEESLFASMLYPSVQLKANGKMFHYPLITVMADKLIQFLEVVESPDKEVIEIILAFHTTIQMVVQARIQGDAGAQGRSLLKALDQACNRYFEQYQK